MKNILSCPFLTKLPNNFIKRYSGILGTYMPYCPAMTGHGGRAYVSTDQTGDSPNSCPFLRSIQPSLKEASPEVTQDIAESNFPAKANVQKSFDYNSFFHKKILEKKDDYSYRIFKKVARIADQPPFASEYTEHEKAITVWCSNDYLGMSSHPKVKEAVRDALEQHGSGSGGTRNISGNTPMHEELEKELAALHRKDAALLFTSCFVANDSTLLTLGKHLPGVVFFSDAGNHASMIQGIRNSGAPKHIFNTCDVLDLERKLQSVDPALPKIVVFETVHSMTGAISPVEEMCDVAHKYGALTFVDEVHAVGLYGEEGAGVAQRDQVMEKLDIVSGTLGKAFGNIGGYVAADGHIVDMIRSYAAGFIFTTSLPPTVLRGALASIRTLRAEEGKQLRQTHQGNVTFLKNALTEAGLPQLPSASHIIPIPVGDPYLCTLISNNLMREYGHYVQSINYPTVPKGEERLRIAPTPFHSEAMMRKFVDHLKRTWIEGDLPLLSDKGNMNNCFYCHRPMNGCKNSLPCGSAVGCPQIMSVY